MRIKHKYANEKDVNYSCSLEHWHKDFFPNKRYLNYDVLEVGEIVDLYEIDPITGEAVFLKTTDKGVAVQMYVLKDSNKYVYRPVAENRLDEHYMPTAWTSKNLLEKSKKRFPKVPSIREIKRRIVESAATKLVGNFIFWSLVTIVGGVIVLLIWKRYELQLTELWEKMFG